jgi:hypothetical protein
VPHATSQRRLLSEAARASFTDNSALQQNCMLTFNQTSRDAAPPVNLPDRRLSQPKGRKAQQLNAVWNSPQLPDK